MYSNILKRELQFDDFGHERLNVYRLAYRLAMEVFEVSKKFPKEEMFSLTDQVRRSSRSVCANTREGYRKRLYPKSFISKMIDVDGEATETTVHIRLAHDCGYISEEAYNYFKAEYLLVGKMINGMIQHPEKFTPGHTATATATATETTTETKSKESK
jgi:four helix bundle protein